MTNKNRGIRAAIVDDSESDLKNIQTALLDVCSAVQLEIKTFTDPGNPQILDEMYDIYLLDIEMSGMNGFSLSQRILNVNSMALILFVSRREDLVFQSFRYHVTYFIRKKMLREDLAHALNQILPAIEKNRQEYVLKSEGTIIRIPYEKLLYIEVDHNTLSVHTKNQIYPSRETIRKAKQDLDSSCFYQPHQSFIVNFIHVISCDGENIVMDNKDRIPVSRKHKKECIAAYQRFLLEKV